MGQRGTILLLAAMVLFSHAAFADFLDASADSSVKTSSPVFVRGYVKLDNFSGVPNVNVSAVLVTSNVSTNTASSGFFEINLTAPATEGTYTITILTNTSLSRTVMTNVRAFSTTNMTFPGSKPPFSNGSTFTVSAIFDGTPTTLPNLIIFNPNGNATSGWTVTNITPLGQAVSYNITIPAAADGEYVLVEQSGAGALFFLVRSSLTLATDVQDASNATKNSFAPSSTARIVAKVRNDDGPITTATVTALVTLPNSTIRSVTLAHSASTNGTYIGTFTETSTHGMYGVRVLADISGRILDSSSFFSVLGYEAKLSTVEDFFFEFGGSSAFAARGQVSFNVLMLNKSSNDDILSGSTNGGTNLVNCSAIVPVRLKNVQTGAILSFTASNITKSVGLFFGQTVCKINFTAPSADSIYALTINITAGNSTANATALATGYFSVQSYVLKASAVSSIGAGNDYMSSLIPGQNATFELSVKNLSSNGTTVNGSLVTAINVTSIMPLNFLGGADNDITDVVYTVTPGADSTNPRVTVVIPENATGPFNIEFQANVAGGTIHGTVFYFAKYIEGFAFPSGFYMGGPGGSSSGAPFKCGGTQTFLLRAFDVQTKQAAKNVVINSIQEARDEHTGKSIKSLLSINSSTVSDSNGESNMSITFSAGSYSGFYFMLINVTTGDGKIDVMPGGFECKTLNFFPMLESDGGYNVGPNSTITVNVSGVKNVANGTPYTVATGTVNIVRLENFDRAKGPRFYTSSISASLAGGSAAINITPANFSLGVWPSGFNNVQVQVCDGSTCDISMGGFMSVAFDAFFDFGFQQPSQVSPRDNLSFTILTRTNVSTVNASNMQNFRITIGQPWAGTSVALQGNATLLDDSWDDSTDFGSERWQVNFTVPADVRKGGNALGIQIKNYRNETAGI